VESRRPSLDDVFLQLTGRSLRDAEAASGSQAGTGPDPGAEPGRDVPSQLQGADR
jgi:ABC-2 type transport system ATP-binding protein